MQPATIHPLLEVESIGDVVVGRFTRRTILDPTTIESVGDQLRALIHEDGARKVLLNFGRVESVTSAMLGKFILLHRDLDAVGGRLAFCQVDSFLEHIFVLCGLPRQIPLFADEPAGLVGLIDPTEHA